MHNSITNNGVLHHRNLKCVLFNIESSGYLVRTSNAIGLDNISDIHSTSKYWQHGRRGTGNGLPCGVLLLI